MNTSQISPVLIAYIPVLHLGYWQFLSNHPEAKKLYVMSDELIALFPHLAKEIRALPPQLVKMSIDHWQLVKSVELLEKATLTTLATQNTPIIAPNEDVVKSLIAKFLPSNQVTYDPIFLRWDKHNTIESFEPRADETITETAFDAQMTDLAYKAAQESSDWWRQVGGVVVKDGAIISVAHNTHLPTPHQPYIDGDPRNNFHKGDHLELSTAIHAEAQLIAEAAKKGISLEGSDMYVTTFPCPPCAKLVASAGIKRLYFHQGYGVLDGQRVLKDAGVSLIRVKKY